MSHYHLYIAGFRLLIDIVNFDLLRKTVACCSICELSIHRLRIVCNTLGINNKNPIGGLAQNALGILRKNKQNENLCRTLLQNKYFKKICEEYSSGGLGKETHHFFQQL